MLKEESGRKQRAKQMGVSETEGPGADCGSVYTASGILALSPGQLMWRRVLIGAPSCAQLQQICVLRQCCQCFLLSRKRERVCVCVDLEDAHRMLVDLQRQTWPADRMAGEHDERTNT